MILKEQDGMTVVTSSIDGTYVCCKEMDRGLFNQLTSHGIEPQSMDNETKISTIGFSEKEQKWYGWSHRAMYGFGIGHKTKEGDCGVPQYIEAGFECKTVEDCKRVAIAFAKDVS